MHTVWGHAYVVEQSPMPNSQHNTSPTEVKLQFNSEVEKNFSLKIYDDANQEVASHSPKLSSDQKEISIQLPTLDDGIYKIQYYIISLNDGHPIQGEYFILVGESTQSIINQGNENPFSTNNSPNNQSGSSTTVLELSIFILKALYYFGFVLLIGWIIWWQTIQNYSSDIRRKFILWGIVFQMVHLVGLISVILIQVDIFTSKGVFFTTNFPFDTNFGLFWLISLVIALSGFLCLFKYRLLDIFWITIVILCKSVNGHASTFDFTYLSVILTSIHLIAAAIWAAGITFIVIFWKKQKLYVKSFFPTFSNYAFISFLLLAITGSIITFIYSQNFAFLTSDWGHYLLIKIMFVAIVVIIAAIIRHKLKSSETKIGKWVKIDFLLMIVIIFIVSILTFLSPTP
ncbi:MAG TPA: copper resistance protein CopC [Ureibacillus sp.]|nr:copper resistance protein CopC [Ureibacillus sp.]